ncbi:IS110 family transposase, partial [Paenibacillus naphthalenovorans]|uniref:IS110 family transposase n=1 Tax=Paenibacillus naphthalenovorans TaxID=162209 RepID=UPI003D2A009A
SKNDTKDAFLLAELIRFGRYSKTAIAAEDLLGLRQLTRFRFSLVDSIGDLKRQVIAIIDTIFPEYETLFSDIFGKTSTELLLAYSTPDEMLAVDTQDLTAFLAKHSRNQFGQAKAELVLQTARNTFGSDIALDAYSFQLRLLLQQIQFAEEQLQCLETEIGRRLEQFDQQLTTVPGIGPVLAASILAEVGDISRFNSPKQLVAFAGLDPSVQQSGQFQGTENHLSKRGSPYLRRAAWLAAMNARRFDPVFKAFYDDKMQRGKHSFTALGAVARKLISVVY